MKSNKRTSSKKGFLLAGIILAVLALFFLKNYFLHNTPEILWKNDSAGIIGNFYADNKLLYYATLDGNYFAVDGQSGRQVWKYDLTSDETILKKPIITDEIIYILSDKNNLHALNSKSGQLVDDKSFSIEDFKKAEISFNDYINGWRLRNDSDHKKTANVEFEDKQFYQEEPFLYSVDKKTGNVIWKKETGRIYSPPIVSNGNLYYLKQNFIFPGDSYWLSLYAVELETGSDVWNWNKSIKSGPVESNGILYVMDDNYLYGLR